MGKLLKKLTEKIQNHKEKLGKKSQLILAGVLAIIMLIIFFNGVTSNEESGSKKETNNKAESSSVEVDYVSGLETRLEKILGSLSAVEDVEVFIMTETSTKTIYATDETTDEKGGTDGVTSISSSVEIVFSKEGSSSQPIVALEIYPEIVGVLVVASAESDEKTRLMILNAVAVALNVENSKIEVLLTNKA